MAAYEIPLSPNPQVFSITLGAKDYRLRLTYQNVAEGGWVVDIADPTTGADLVTGIPLVTGADIISPYPDAGIAGALYVATDGDPDAVPTFDNLGVASHLYFVVP